MIKVDIIRWKKSAKYLNWTFILCFVGAMTIILLDERVNDFLKAFGLLLLIPSVVSLAILTFMNKSKSIGTISFDNEVIVIEIDGHRKELDYKLIDKLYINNYNGQQFFSIKSIYPFHDGLNNYCWIDSEKGIDKFEVKIDSEEKYKSLERLFKQRKTDDKNRKWKIKPL